MRCLNGLSISDGQMAIRSDETTGKTEPFENFRSGRVIGLDKSKLQLEEAFQGENIEYR